MSLMEYRTLMRPADEPGGAPAPHGARTADAALPAPLPAPPRARSVAIAFDRETGSFYGHGSAERVATWLDDVRRRYRARGLDEIAESLALWEARLTAEELARCMRCPATLLALYAARRSDDAAP